MSTISSAMGNAGALLTFEHDGKTYPVSYLTQGVQSAFEQWLKSGALSMLPLLEETLSPEKYEAEKKAVLRQIKEGEMGFHGEIAAAARKTPDGMLFLSSRLFGCSKEEMAKLVVARQQDILNLLEVIFAESSPKASAKND